MEVRWHREVSLKPGDRTTQNREMRDEEAAALSLENSALDKDLFFVLFVLTQTGCGVPVEVRLDEGLLLEWCPRCAVMETFGAPGG